MLNQSRLEALLDQWEQAIEDDPGVNVDDFVASVCVGDDSTLADDLRGKITKLQRMYSFVDNFESRTDDPTDSPENQLRIEAGAEPVPGYRLAKLIAHGGYGQVWEAIGPGDFVVALKFVRLTGRGVIEQEALEFAKQARHPNLIATHGAWNTEGYLIVAMERAEATLMERFDFFRMRGEKGIPRDELVRHMIDAAAGLDHLNQAHNGRPGIQHRDVKPQNLLLVGDRVKVADFGISKIVQDQDTGHTGAMTVGYAAPEFFQGRTTSQSDQYSLAVTYCFLLTGQMPFSGSNAEVMNGHISGTPNLSALSSDDQKIVSRALSKQPNARWDRCSTFADALLRPSNAPSAIPTLHRGKVMAAIALMFLVFFVVVLFRGRNEGDMPKPAEKSPMTGMADSSDFIDDAVKGLNEEVSSMKSSIESHSVEFQKEGSDVDAKRLLIEMAGFLSFSLVAPVEGKQLLDQDIEVDIDQTRYQQFANSLSESLGRDAKDKGSLRLGFISPRASGFASLRYDLVHSGISRSIYQAMVDESGCVVILGRRVVDVDWGEYSEVSLRERTCGNQVLDCTWFAVSENVARPLQNAFRSLRNLSLSVVQRTPGQGDIPVFSINPLAWDKSQLREKTNLLPGGPCGALNSFVGPTGELNLNVARDRLEQSLERGSQKDIPDITERVMLVWPGFYQFGFVNDHAPVGRVAGSQNSQWLTVQLPEIE